ncbi:MAG TPA: hypothetical protein VD994_16680, partial [Prosthecobacter sp.]|nr:hypothetical protein [Prosthecobacter sp.]
WLAAVHMDGHLCVWEKSSERQLLRWKLDSLSRHARLVASPNGDWLALTGIDGAVRLFNLSPQAGPVEGGAEAQRNRQTE